LEWTPGHHPVQSLDQSRSY